MSYKCAFLGCGPRSNGHAAAYEYINRGETVACCDVNEERLNTYAETHGIANRYTDLDEMLEKEKPDVVHLVTPPTLRVGLMTKLSDAVCRLWFIKVCSLMSVAFHRRTPRHSCQPMSCSFPSAVLCVSRACWETVRLPMSVHHGRAPSWVHHVYLCFKVNLSAANRQN